MTQSFARRISLDSAICGYAIREKDERQLNDLRSFEMAEFQRFENTYITEALGVSTGISNA